MKKIKIPFYKTSAKVDERLEKCLSSGWMTSGPVVQEFENSLAIILMLNTWFLLTLARRVTSIISCSKY